MPYCPILTTLVYITREHDARRQVLLCHRIARTDDLQLGKYNGVGGKLERHEDPVTGMLREVSEETGLVPTAWQLRGTLNWPGFAGPDGDVFGFVFLVTGFTGTAPERNVEGTLSWHDLDELATLPMYEGDAYFLRLVFDSDPRAFHAVIPYADGRPTGCTMQR